MLTKIVRSLTLTGFSLLIFSKAFAIENNKLLFPLSIEVKIERVDGIKFDRDNNVDTAFITGQIDTCHLEDFEVIVGKSRVINCYSTLTPTDNTPTNKRYFINVRYDSNSKKSFENWAEFYQVSVVQVLTDMEISEQTFEREPTTQFVIFHPIVMRVKLSEEDRVEKARDKVIKYKSVNADVELHVSKNCKAPMERVQLNTDKYTDLKCESLSKLNVDAKLGVYQRVFQERKFNRVKEANKQEFEKKSHLSNTNTGQGYSILFRYNRYQKIGN